MPDMSRPTVNFQRTYVTPITADLRKVYVRDTIVVDDTGPGDDDTSLFLPKIGTAYAPVGLRITIVKPSDATHVVSITPEAPDEVSSPAGGPFPNFSATNNGVLPAGHPGSVTLEATDMSLTASPQPNPSGGTPNAAGAWLAVGSGAGGNAAVGVQSVTGGDGISISGTDFNPIISVSVINDAQHGELGGGLLHDDAIVGTAGFMSAADKLKLDQLRNGSGAFTPAGTTTILTPFVTATSSVQITRRGLVPGTPVGIPQVLMITAGVSFDVVSLVPATGMIDPLDAGAFNWTISNN